MSTPAADTRTLVIEKTFAHPPEKLWRALTESPLIAQWLMNNNFQPTVGHKFEFRSEPMPGWDGIIESEVRIVEPLKQLSYTWNALGLASVVLFTLTPAEGGTHLRMEHSGFAAGQQANYQGANYGWQKFLGALDHLLNRLV